MIEPSTHKPIIPLTILLETTPKPSTIGGKLHKEASQMQSYLLLVHCPTSNLRNSLRYILCIYPQSFQFLESQNQSIYVLFTNILGEFN